jgi:hypothetical protein
MFIVEPMIFAAARLAADVIAAAILSEAILQCKAGRWSARNLGPDTRKLKAKASTANAQKQYIGIAVPLNDGLATSRNRKKRRKTKLPTALRNTAPAVGSIWIRRT